MILEIYKEVYEEKFGWTVEFLDYLEKTMWRILEFANLPSIRQYHEIFILHLLKHFPERFVHTLEYYLRKKDNKTQFLVSIAWVTISSLLKIPYILN